MSYKKKFSGFITKGMQRRYSSWYFFIVMLFCFTVPAFPEEIRIPGDSKLEESFSGLSKKGQIEKEFHLYATDGYQEMADGELIYFWGFTHAKDFVDVGEIKTREERDGKLLPLKVPGDEIRLISGKNYIVVLHNAGFYEIEKHSGIHGVPHTIHFHGLDWKPNYFVLNGRIFMDNLSNPLSTVNDPKTRIVAYEGETVLIRLMAVRDITISLHGIHTGFMG